MGQQPVAGQRSGQARGQPGVVGQRADQRHARVRHNAGPAASDGQAPLPACTVHLEGAPRLGLDKGFDTRILPSQEHLFPALVR
jgi:hypothetical protein